MKKELLLSAMLLLTACSSSDDPSVEPTEPTVPTDTTVVADPIPAGQFLEAFCQGGWVEAEVYDEFADGSTGKEILSSVEGYVSRSFSIVDDKLVRQYHSSSADLSYFAVDTVAYAYDESEGTLVFMGGKLNTSLKETFTVLSIEDDEMRCRGKVFSKEWAPDAVSGIYVFKRMTAEELDASSSIWQDEQWQVVPVRTDPIDEARFDELFRNSGWTETGVFNMYEDGTVSEQNLFNVVSGFTSSKFYVDQAGIVTEYLNYDYDASVLATNQTKYSYANHRIVLQDAHHGDLRRIFYILSINDKEVRCIGWPWMNDNEPGVVRSGYIFERVSDDVVEQWRETWGL